MYNYKVFRHDVKLYATLVEYASVFSLWSLVVSYHKDAKPWNLECIFHAHWKNGSAEQLIPFLFKCAGMLVHCFLLFNTWHHWILDSTLRANNLLATDWGLSDHTYNLLHHKQWPWSIINNDHDQSSNHLSSQLIFDVIYEVQSLVTSFRWPRTLVSTVCTIQAYRFNLPDRTW